VISVAAWVGPNRPFSLSDRLLACKSEILTSYKSMTSRTKPKPFCCATFRRREPFSALENAAIDLSWSALEMTLTRVFIVAVAGLIGSSFSSSIVQAAPADQAIETFRNGSERKDVVQNRFFLKTGRFELAPMGGMVPNNPMVKRYVGGLQLAYHFSETFAAGGQLLYSPDLGENDLKGLANTLVQIAQGSAGGGVFQQPIDKLILGATFSAQWAPIYGKINILGETILNFDLYGEAGLGMLSIQKAYARYDSNAQGAVPVTIDFDENTVEIPVSLGIGLNVFLNQSMAFKLDARSLMYIDSAPDYELADGVRPEENQLYRAFAVTAGFGFYFPKMKPRLSDF
jgi:outer membrane beta-barrel protein